MDQFGLELVGGNGPTPQATAEGRVGEVFASIAVPIPVAILSTALRLWTELYLHRNGLKLDTLLIIWATVCITF